MVRRRLLRVAELTVDLREVLQGRRDVGALRAEDLLLDREGPLAERRRLRVLPFQPQDAGQVVEGDRETDVAGREPFRLAERHRERAFGARKVLGLERRKAGLEAVLPGPRAARQRASEDHPTIMTEARTCGSGSLAGVHVYSRRSGWPPGATPRIGRCVVTLLETPPDRCVCGHGPWSHRLLAFRPAEGQLLRTTGICSGGICECQTYEKRGPQAVPPHRPRRIPPIGYAWQMEL